MISDVLLLPLNILKLLYLLAVSNVLKRHGELAERLSRYNILEILKSSFASFILYLVIVAKLLFGTVNAQSVK